MVAVWIVVERVDVGVDGHGYSKGLAREMKEMEVGLLVGLTNKARI